MQVQWKSPLSVLYSVSILKKNKALPGCKNWGWVQKEECWQRLASFGVLMCDNATPKGARAVLWAVDRLTALAGLNCHLSSWEFMIVQFRSLHHCVSPYLWLINS